MIAVILMGFLSSEIQADSSYISHSHTISFNLILTTQAKLNLSRSLYHVLLDDTYGNLVLETYSYVAVSFKLHLDAIGRP